MSLIDDVVSKRFTRGKKFKVNNKLGSFQRNLSEAVIKSPSLSGLKDNKDSLNAVVDKYEKYIRQDKVTKSMREKMLREAIKSDPSLTKSDVKNLKVIFKHLSKEGAVKVDSSAIKKTSVSAQRRAEAKASFRTAPIRGVPDFLQKRAAASISDNPLSRQPYTPKAGSGGGVGAAKGRGSLAGGTSVSKPTFRPPSLLK